VEVKGCLFLTAIGDEFVASCVCFDLEVERKIAKLAPGNESP
jgi:hypothetical protein